MTSTLIMGEIQESIQKCIIEIVGIGLNHPELGVTVYTGSRGDTTLVCAGNDVMESVKKYDLDSLIMLEKFIENLRKDIENGKRNPGTERGL